MLVKRLSSIYFYVLFLRAVFRLEALSEYRVTWCFGGSKCCWLIRATFHAACFVVSSELLGIGVSFFGQSAWSSLATVVSENSAPIEASFIVNKVNH